VDVDHFKAVNDTHGHLVGDEVLRRVAKTLNKSIRGGDSAARYGGEEFVLVINTADVKLCRVISERIRRAVETTPMPEPVDHVTVSVGVACTRPGRHDMANRLLELADQALYAAKQDGRNCVRISEESLVSEEGAETERTDGQPAPSAS
jgi:diguanylate cyclase (GGDEF)-like protein